MKNRKIIIRSTLTAILVLCASVWSYAQAIGVDNVGLTVSDMPASVEFYSKVLHFKKISDEVLEGSFPELPGQEGKKRVVEMSLGDETLELTQYISPTGRPAPEDARSNDLWFQHVAIIVRDMDRAYVWLKENQVEHISPAPQVLPDWNPNAGGIAAFYFRDPDGHPLEILSFPPDKGRAKWHQPTDRLFLGIDHTAIATKNTAESLKFYVDDLGFKVAGESTNYGPEQERLNNVAGAKLHITGLAAPAGPAVEFLEYLMPQDGRPFPVDEKANDLVHWQTTVLVENSGEVEQDLKTGGYTFITDGFEEFPVGKVAMVRDPSGHVIKLVEQY